MGLSVAAPPRTIDCEDRPVETLTSREMAVLACVADGLPTRAIARKLFISPCTVRNHVQSVLQKLDVHSKLAAVVYAFRHEML